MAIIDKSAYFVISSIYISRRALYQTDYVLDTGAPTNSVARMFLSECWSLYRQTAEHMHRCALSMIQFMYSGKWTQIYAEIL